MENKNYFNKILDVFLNKILDVFLNKTKRKLLLLTIFGFILRLISARNLGLHPDDSNHAVSVIGIFNSGKLVNYGQSTILWYYVQGVFYKIFGATQIGSRFACILFGSLLIILTFLFVKRIFKSDRIALISSFLVAICPLLIKMTLPEMDIAVSFFIIFSAYFLFGYLESKSKKDFILMALFMGVAIMIKLYALFFVASFILFLLYKEYKTEKNYKGTFKKIFLFLVIIFILITPTLTHNYLLYKDKGFMDLIFTNVFRLGVDKAEEFYSWNAGWLASSDYGGFFFGNQKIFMPETSPGIFIMLESFFKFAPILSILGLLGLILAFKTKRDYFWFFILMFIPAFIYLGAQIPMIKHFIWGIVLIAPVAGNVLNKFSKKFKIKLKYILLIILLFNLIYLGAISNGTKAFYSHSGAGQLVEFKEKNIGDNALIIADSRIYRGYIHWIFNGKSYIEAGEFFNVADQLSTIGEPQNIEVYYIECVTDDCGWGTIKNQPEFNQTMEELTGWFSDNSIYSKEIIAPKKDKSCLPFICEKQEYYRIYKLNLMLNPIILEVVKQQSWFLYPIAYDRRIAPIFDDYEVRGFDILLEKFAWVILYFELIFSFFAIFYIMYLFLKQD